MSDNNLQNRNFEKINRLINSSRFNESFLLLKRGFRQLGNREKLLEKLNKLEDNYKYMLDFLASGNSDPSQKETLESLKDNLHGFNDSLLRENRLIDSSDSYSSSKRMFLHRNTTLEELIDNFKKAAKPVDSFLENQPEENINESEIADKEIIENETSENEINKEMSDSMAQIFNYVWTMHDSSNDDYKTLSASLDDERLPEYLKAVMISAMTLGSISYLDYEILDILLDVYDNSDSLTLKSRALVGILLISLIHNKRISGNLHISSRLRLSSDNDNLKNWADEVILNIIRTFDTRRIDNKMRNEVIPELMKIRPEFIEKMKNMAADSEDFLSEGNPEWEDFIENSEFGNKLQEINDMQLEGADVMVTAFSNLKSFPFFNRLHNWFLPFIPYHYEYKSLKDLFDNETVDNFSLVMCDSDLNSFMLSLAGMPESQRNMMLSNMKAQMKEAHVALSDAVGETEEKIMSRKIRRYLQDLYRFFNFYRKKDEFKNPFSLPFLSSDIEPLMPLWGIDENEVLVIGEFYFKNKYYPEAAGFYALYDTLIPGNFNIWEKLGYINDRLQNYPQAVEWYQKAELLNPDNPWLVKKLAIALKNANQHEKAIAYYEKALNNEPENYHLLMSMGQSLMEMGNYPDALKRFYHANYLKPEKLGALRAIAWSELLEGNMEKAKQHYQNLMSMPKAEKEDFLNAAHLALASGDFKSALNLYRQFVEKTENKDITALVLAFKDDSETLKKLKIKTSDLRLIVDKIRYDLIS